MGSSKQKTRAGYPDVLGAPPHRVAEVVDGELYTSPRPAARHSLAASVLGGKLVSTFHHGSSGPGGWVILFEPELHLGNGGEQIVVPDLAGWRRLRMPEMPDAAFFTLAPDWICEVLSPATMALDRVGKMRVYAEAEVAHAWLVEPAACTLETFRRAGTEWVATGSWQGDARMRAEPFEAIELDLAPLWRR